MSVYEEHHASFNFWEGNLATATVPLDGQQVEGEVTPTQLELAQLQFTVGAIRRRLESLGAQSATLSHSWNGPETDTRNIVVVRRTFPAGKPIPEQLSFARILTNQIRRTDGGLRIADTEEIFIDLREESAGARSYQGHAVDSGQGLVLRPASPPIASRQVAEVKYVNAAGYEPKLPKKLNAKSSFTELNQQRVDAGLALDLLEKLGPGTEDLRVPYGS